MKVNMKTTSYIDGKKAIKNYETGFVPDEKETEMYVVNLYPNVTYQTWDGFGGALTESSGYTLSKMSPENYTKVVNAYYGKDGIGYTFGRLHLDSCDFSLDNYCAVNDSKDKDFKTFSLKRDGTYIQPLLKKVNEACPGKVTLMLSPWSPPEFMKTTKTRNGGGRLEKENYGSWAKYIVKYIKEYKKLGFVIDCVTIQNEPLAIQPWDSCQYSSVEEKDFLKNHLYPELKASGLEKIGIYIWDHNKERIFERANDIIDQETESMIEGIAFHWYTGDHFEAVQIARDLFPNQKLMHTEGCVEYTREGLGNELEHAQKYAHDIIGDLNAGTNGFVDWNITLDEIGGPNHVGNYCGAPIMCDTVNDKVEFKLSYDYIGHFSTYIRPGAKRIGFSKYTEHLEMTAFKNTDGTIASVLLNRTEKPIFIQLRVNNHMTRLSVKEHSISTIVVS